MADQIDAGLGLLCDGAIQGEGPTMALVRELHGLVTRGAGAGIQALAARPPQWSEPVLVAAWQSATEAARMLTAERDLPPLPVKACLPGPYTLARWIDPGDVGREPLIVSLAEALAQEVRALIAAGAPVVQIDEPGLIHIGPDDDAERALATAALTRLTDGVSDPEAHLCLAVAGGSAEHAGPDLLFERPFRSYLFDLISGPDDWRLIARAPRDRGIVCGVADARTDAPDDEPVMIWAARYAASLNGRGPDRVGLSPSAGFEALSTAAARSKMGGLARAASKAGLSAGTLATRIDPRAVDARSAAMGRYEPRAAALPEEHGPGE
ncbi:MAG: hypothetical protein M3432_07555, partial [Chloroflexota bacterium]|nr:hypothetical protein [Chloroflexota bacterium]